MRNIYLYGASDDCHELDSDCGISAESYNGLRINDVYVDYEFDGDWKINLRGEIPPHWIVKKIEGTSDFIHIQIPEGAQFQVYEPYEETPKQGWKPIN